MGDDLLIKALRRNPVKIMTGQNITEWAAERIQELEAKLAKHDKNLPKDYVSEGLARAGDWRIFGVPVLELSEIELVAALCNTLKRERDESERHMDFMRAMRK